MVLRAQVTDFTASLHSRQSGITEHRRRTGCDFPLVASNHTATVRWGG